MAINLHKIPTPCYVCLEKKLEKNLKILDRVQEESGAKILVALKGFAMWSTFPLLRKYLYGVCGGGLNEARLGREKFRREVHIFDPAYKDEEFNEMARLSDHLVFNTFSQWRRFRHRVPRGVKCAIRINPEYAKSPVKHYNPSSPFSAFGVLKENFQPELLEGISGLHFHLLCEQGADALEEALAAFEKKFGEFIPRMEWVNFGGGHHITREGYNVEKLIRLINGFRKRYPNIKDIYLEPGEAIGWQVGPLVVSVLEIVRNKGKNIGVIDASWEAHMPDTIIMPYDPQIAGAQKEQRGNFTHQYYLRGISCLSGDIKGPYYFSGPLKIGDKLAIEDQIHYTFVKSTMFSGVHPSLAIWTKRNKLKMVRRFGYDDFKSRLS